MVNNKESNTSFLHEMAEPLLIFSVFFLPGYISQGTQSVYLPFGSLYFHLFYLITILPRIFLLLYIIGKKAPETREKIGLKPFSFHVIPKSILLGLSIFLVIIPFAFIFQFFSGNFLPDPLPVSWETAAISIFPMILVTCLVTGYSEELFFRAYLLTVLPGTEKEMVPAVIGSALLFAAGHLYQGIAGFIVTFCIGMYLSCWFLKKRDLHLIAVAHGIYNFVILTISYLVYSAGAG